MAKFKQEVLNAIKSDPDLFAAVAKEMGVKPWSLGPMIDRNGATLNQYSVVAVVAAHLGKDAQELLEEDAEKEAIK